MSSTSRCAHLSYHHTYWFWYVSVSVKYPLLGSQQFANFTRMPLLWKSWLRGTLRTYSRYDIGSLAWALLLILHPIQCILPVLEDLFPQAPHNRVVSDLVFTLAEWHANAKLRLHTSSTVAILQELTHIFGIQLCHFCKHICPDYDTRELPKEEAARVCRQLNTKACGKVDSMRPCKAPKKTRQFNMST